MGEKEQSPVNPVLAGVVLVLTALGWLVTELSPQGPFTTAVDVGTALLLVGFSVYALITVYTEAIPDIEVDAARADSSADQSIRPESKALSEAGPRDVARLLRAARPLPAFVLIALLPIIFPHEGQLTVPVLGVVPFPWYGFPIAALFACIAFYWWFLWMSPLPLVRGK
ncbi:MULTISPECIES: hypothetical protein [Haloarcula]|uniref:hypothetical protein n=1 Tax=Haloarcula TaxID=2237 RepID=UPI0023E85AD0|nr:hypothetical protein [Halomicroarcula sp. SHR3]